MPTIINEVPVLTNLISVPLNRRSNSLSLFNSLILAVTITVLFAFAPFCQAKAEAKSETGLPLPRFASLKSKRVNMRVGPGRDYKVQWLYLRKGLPVEIFQEFGNWRKIRDPRGNEGWVLHSLLSGKRFVIVTPWEMRKSDASENPKTLPTINMYQNPATSAAISARMEAGSLADIDHCSENWCKIDVVDEKKVELSGYVQKTSVWGVYPDEVLEN